MLTMSVLVFCVRIVISTMKLPLIIMIILFKMKKNFNIQMFPGSIYFNIVCILLYFVHLSLYYLYCLMIPNLLPMIIVFKQPLFNLKCQIKLCLPRPPAEIRKTIVPIFPHFPAPHFPLLFPFNS
jgi:hypothetical protein